jgi:flagellar biosynthetic protein FliP
MTRRRLLAAVCVAAFGLAAALLLTAGDASAQTFTLDLGDGDSTTTGRIVQLIALITVLSLAPSILIMVTAFTRIVVVLAFVRTAMGTQQTPPTQVLISLALFLTLFIMAPTFQAAYDNAIRPMINGEMDEIEAFDRAVVPFRQFMLQHVREQDLALFLDAAGEPDVTAPEAVPLRALIPAFMISELRRAFEIGFLLFVPFLVIDMVVASVLMSMGMMMLPPIIVSIPFKIIFFVLVDGWYMLAGSLIRSYGG